MAGTGKNLVFASRAAGNGKEGGPTYVEGILGENDILPGTAVDYGASGFDVYNSGTSTRDPLIMDINAVKQGNMSDLWLNGETGVALQPRPGQKFNMRAAAGITANLGTPLSLDGVGRVKVAVATEVIVGYLDETVSATSADDLVRVRWSTGVGRTV